MSVDNLSLSNIFHFTWYNNVGDTVALHTSYSYIDNISRQ